METLAILATLVADFDVTRLGGGARMEWIDEQHILVEVSGDVARLMHASLKPNVARDRCHTIRVNYSDPLLISRPFSDEAFCVFNATVGGDLGLTGELPMVQEGQVEKNPWTRAKYANGTLQILKPPSEELLAAASPSVCGEYRTRRGGQRMKCSFELPREWLK